MRHIALLAFATFVCSTFTAAFVIERNRAHFRAIFQLQKYVASTKRPSIFLFSTTPLSVSGSSDQEEGSLASPLLSEEPSVICVGETLWDCLPGGLYLGGAPTNVAIHLASMDVPTAILSCIGEDRLGDETVRRIRDRGVYTQWIQRNPRFSTGMVVATVDKGTGDATYAFDTPSSWDYLEYPPAAAALPISPDSDSNAVVVLGTLCGRLGAETTSGETVLNIRRNARRVVLDVNLRPPWYTPEWVRTLAMSGNPLSLIKVNEEELSILEGWSSRSSLLRTESDDEDEDFDGRTLEARMKDMAATWNAHRVCVTRGSEGAALWCGGEEGAIFAENKGYPNNDDGRSDSDTVGAGDAFLAALVRSLLLDGELPTQALDRACALGGYVATCPGATPDHGDAPSYLRDVFSITKDDF